MTLLSPIFHEPNSGLGLGENAGLVIEDILEDALHFQVVVAVAHTGNEIETAGALFGVVVDHTTGRDGIRNDLRAIIQRDHGRGNNPDIFNHTLTTASDDVVVYLIRLEDNDKNSGGEV